MWVGVLVSFVTVAIYRLHLVIHIHADRLLLFPDICLSFVHLDIGHAPMTSSYNVLRALIRRFDIFIEEVSHPCM